MKTLMLAAAVVAVGATAQAAPVTFGFGTAHDNLGHSHTYTQAGLTVIATGYDGAGALTDLWGKHAGGDESGLGLHNDSTGDNEIEYGHGFVQLDVSQLFGKVLPGSVFFTTGSTSGTEEWGVFGSNVAGVHGTAPLITGKSEGANLLPDFGTYKYYDFQEVHAHAGDNILLASFGAQPGAVPEPATWALMLLGFGAAGATLRSRRRSALAA